MSVVLVSNDIHQTQISKRKRTCRVVKIVNHTPPSYAQSRLTRLISTRSHIMHANNLGPITYHGKPQYLVGVSDHFTQRSVHPTAVCLASHAGVFRRARISSLPTNACSTEDNIPFPCLANHIVLSKFWKVDLDRKVI